MPARPWTMRSLKRPPTRRSISTDSRGVSNPAGPNQLATWSGSVHALNTSARGASKTRVIVICCSAVVESVIALSFLDFSQVFVEPIHAALPNLSVLLDPRRGLVEALGTESRGPELRRPVACDQAGAFEHLQVARDRGQADAERLGQLRHGGLSLGQPGQDGPAGGIGECREGCAELVGRHLHLT